MNGIAEARERCETSSADYNDAISFCYCADYPVQERERSFGEFFFGAPESSGRLIAFVEVNEAVHWHDTFDDERVGDPVVGKVSRQPSQLQTHPTDIAGNGKYRHDYLLRNVRAKGAWAMLRDRILRARPLLV